MSLLSQTLDESGKVPFAGLSPRDTKVEVPPELAESLDLPRYPDASLKDIIELLPNAEARKVFIDNEFVAGNSMVATDEVREFVEQDEALSGDLKAFDDESGDLFDVDRREPERQAHDVKAVVDRRREALHALGHDVKYHWQVASDSYTIINPTDWYYICYRTLEQSGERDCLGWVEFDDYGGSVDLYILLPSQRFIPPSVADAEGYDDEESRRPVLLGFNSGYRFDGSRSLDFELFGFDTEHCSTLWSLGEQKTQPHRGNVMQYAEEWWSGGYESIQEGASLDGELLEAIADATELKLDFDDAEWTVEEFIEYLELPYAEEIADRAVAMAGENGLISCWNLYVNINTVLANEYSGDTKSRNSLTFQGHVRKARQLLRKPKTEINRARKKYEEAEDADMDVDEAQRTLTESVESIEGVTRSESELSTLEKMNITEQVQQTLS